MVPHNAQRTRLFGYPSRSWAGNNREIAHELLSDPDATGPNLANI
jgi:hypothetical protein